MDLMERTCHFERMNIERVFARGFIILGAIIWVAAVFGADFGYRSQTVFKSAGSALVPLALAVVVFLLGWFYEKLAALVLGVGTIAAIIYGVFAGWEPNVWGIMTLALIAPMAIGALLFLLAARMQAVCELEEKAKA